MLVSAQYPFVNLLHAGKRIFVTSSLSKLPKTLSNQTSMLNWTGVPLARFCRYSARHLQRETDRRNIEERALRIAKLGSLRLLVGSASEDG